MAMIERILTVSLIIIFGSALLLIALYQLYKFALDGGFNNSFSGRLLIAGICFNIVLIGIIFYLILEISLLKRLLDRINQELIEEEPHLTLKDRILQTLRGRSCEKKKKNK